LQIILYGWKAQALDQPLVHGSPQLINNIRGHAWFINLVLPEMLRMHKNWTIKRCHTRTNHFSYEHSTLQNEENLNDISSYKYIHVHFVFAVKHAFAQPLVVI
jgi:hypothetical protein